MITKIVAGVVTFFGVLFGMVLVFGSWGTVDAGHRGVVLQWGGVNGDIKGEGFYTKTPWVQSVFPMDIRQQKEQVETEAASKDLQTVHTIIALNLSLGADKCAWVYQTIGKDYLQTVVAPAMQESIKAVIAHYTAEELITKREEVRQHMITLMSEKLTPLGINTNSINIVNFDFSQAFNHAIEAKVTAEQNALAARNTLAQVEFEAQQRVATAKGKAESMQLESAAIAKNPQILQLRALEKWNGILPAVMTGALPFVDVKSITQ